MPKRLTHLPFTSVTTRPPMLASRLNRIANRVLAPSKSARHENSTRVPPLDTGVPIWMHGFARSGTTTCMARAAKALDRNAVFEPGHARNLELAFAKPHEDVIWSMRSVPRREDWDDYFVGDGVLSAYETFDEGLEDLPQWARFKAYLDTVYETFGLNSVVKEIRLFANLEALERYHRERGLPWLFVGLLAPPTVPLNAYYRRGWLTGGSLRSFPAELDQGHAYRVRTFERLGRFSELTGLPARSPAEKMLVNCLLDQAELRRFVAEDPEHRLLSGLPQLESAIDWLSARTEGSERPSGAGSEVERLGHGVDRHFHRDVIEALDPAVREAFEAAWGPAVIDETAAGNGLKGRVRSLRHRLFLP